MTNGPSGEMPFLDHLEELRYRLLWAVGSLGVAMMLAFAVIMRPSFDVIGFFAAPILPLLPSHKLVYTHPVDPVTTAITPELAHARRVCTGWSFPAAAGIFPVMSSESGPLA